MEIKLSGSPKEIAQGLAFVKMHYHILADSKIIQGRNPRYTWQLQYFRSLLVEPLSVEPVGNLSKPDAHADAATGKIRGLGEGDRQYYGIE